LQSADESAAQGVRLPEQKPAPVVQVQPLPARQAELLVMVAQALGVPLHEVVSYQSQPDASQAVLVERVTQSAAVPVQVETASDHLQPLPARQVPLLVMALHALGVPAQVPETQVHPICGMHTSLLVMLLQACGVPLHALAPGSHPHLGPARQVSFVVYGLQLVRSPWQYLRSPHVQPLAAHRVSLSLT
jgi:hypothetical protein